jgi:drug/metabolite transporter (DMT)-like permease
MVSVARPTETESSRANIALAFFAVYTLWGSTYLAIRFAIETLPPFLMAGVRFLIAGVLMYAWARWKGAPRPTLSQWRGGIVVGGLLLMGGNGAVVWAEQRVPSGLTSLLVATVPLMVVLIETFVLGRKRPGPAVWAGLALGFAGLALLVGPGLVGGQGGVDPVAAGVLLCGTLSWTTGSLYSRSAPLPPSPILAIAVELLGGGILLCALAVVHGDFAHAQPSAMSLRSGMAFVYLIIFGSIIGFSCYVWLLRVVRPAMVATYAFVNPVVAMFLGWALANEPLTTRALLASVVIIAGVACITLRRRPS